MRFAFFLVGSHKSTDNREQEEFTPYESIGCAKEHNPSGRHGQSGGGPICSKLLRIMVINISFIILAKKGYRRRKARRNQTYLSKLGLCPLTKALPEWRHFCVQNAPTPTCWRQSGRHNAHSHRGQFGSVEKPSTPIAKPSTIWNSRRWRQYRCCSKWRRIWRRWRLWIQRGFWRWWRLWWRCERIHSRAFKRKRSTICSR